MKLHLGCGERYLEGYKNIDYPPSEHTVQNKSVADEFSDITTLKFDKETIDEVRLHHVFEHFDRVQACALVAIWHKWLVAGGVLRIEVPDFNRTAKAVLSPFTSLNRKMVALRHIFGSQEAKWAVHYDGHDPKRLKALLGLFGYGRFEIKKNSWLGTHNFEITAHKVTDTLSVAEYRGAGESYLKQFLLDESDGETAMLKVWMKNFDNILNSYL